MPLRRCAIFPFLRLMNNLWETDRTARSGPTAAVSSSPDRAGSRKPDLATAGLWASRCSLPASENLTARQRNVVIADRIQEAPTMSKLFALENWMYIQRVVLRARTV